MFFQKGICKDDGDDDDDNNFAVNAGLFVSRLYSGWYLLIRSLLRLLDSLEIHMRVDKVYTGRKSPINGMNSAMFIAVDSLLFVIEYNKLVIKESNMSPIMGVLKSGATK
jgi:hypothetical protein